MELYRYADTFFEYQQIGALSSARAAVPLMRNPLLVTSVLDVGCGAGAWVAAWLEAGVKDVVGVDAEYVDPRRLMFDPVRFTPLDVSRPFDLGRRFALAQCLEVAEHLDSSASETLVDNLVAHAPIVVFSAAPPGQGGEHHVNERPYAFWRDLFARRGYQLFDYLRPRLALQRGVEHWYRYNTLLFVSANAVEDLPDDVIATAVPPDAPVPDVAPASWRLRRAVLAPLPPAAVTWMAGLKHRAVLRSHSRGDTP